VRDNVDVANFRYPTETELRVYVIQSTHARGEMLRAPTSVERDVCREQLQEGISHGGLPGRGEREPRTTNVADHSHDLDRLAIGVRVIPFAEEQSTARGGRQAAQ
jgi:hypothetical protein